MLFVDFLWWWMRIGLTDYYQSSLASLCCKPLLITSSFTQQKFISCWCYVFSIGGQGTSGSCWSSRLMEAPSLHLILWSLQLWQVIGCLHTGSQSFCQVMIQVSFTHILLMKANMAILNLKKGQELQSYRTPERRCPRISGNTPNDCHITASIIPPLLP